MLNYTYDAAGNMQSDGTNRYTFDAENRIACMNPDINWVCNTNSISYTYDADGQRVKKSDGTNYWYGPSGDVLAETDNSGAWTNYIFFGGQHLARNVPQPAPNPPDIKYYITDHLHSTAMFVDKTGTTAAILDDNDMYPWGGIVPGIGKTTSTNTIKFTGQYRDTESQLDYFGARYYSNSIGRFMSPDWAAKPTTVPYAKFGDPQSLNLYTYVENGPVNRIDPDGHNYVFEPFQDWGFDIRQGINGSQSQGSADSPQPQQGSSKRDDQPISPPPDGPRTSSTGNTVPIPLPIVVGVRGTALATGAALTAAATSVIAAAYVLITRVTDTVVANNEDKQKAEAVYSVVAVENVLLMSDNKQTLKVVKGLVTAAGLELAKVTGGDPGDNHHRGEGRALLDRAKRLADRLPPKLREAVLQSIKTMEGKVPGGIK